LGNKTNFPVSGTSFVEAKWPPLQLPDVHNDQTVGRHRHGRTRFGFSRAKLNWSTTSLTAFITYFANTAGVRSFAWGENSALGGKFHAVRVNCLDGVDIDELVNAPVTYFDGANDKYDSAPAEIRHL
jgi:hypothetical protein